VPIVREPERPGYEQSQCAIDGAGEKNAAQIYRVLRESSQMTNTFTPEQLTHWVIEQINSVPGLSVEYFEIVDGDSLQSISSWNDAGHIVGCIAVYCGAVRLIDNIRYK